MSTATIGSLRSASEYRYSRLVQGFRILQDFQAVSFDPKVADLAPSAPGLTDYDEQNAVTYMRILDAEADNADWREVARIVLCIDPALEPDRARRAFDSHLARARWVARHGYRHLLRRDRPTSE
ncbi:DNA -binding domain-containing protein [Bradyrhizobium elkanii]|uniref:DNA -binding domain-containing protein n=1 Tax=Bradyrhizobium elkanii TaxID=29448 RepID=UPI003517F5E0